MNSPQKQSGDVLALVLVVVVAALVVMSGWIVVDQTVNRDRSSNHDHSGHAEHEWLEDELDETEDWLKIETEQFSMRVPDGWELMRVDNGEYGMYLSAGCPGQECLQYRPGTKATVRDASGGSDGLKPFFVKAYTSEEWVVGKAQIEGYERVGNIKADGIEGAKYSHLYVAGEAIGIGAVETDTQEYAYVFEHKGTVLYVSYYLAQGEKDNTVTVERAIRTLRFE